MSQHNGGDDPLLKAIGEFRQELIGWIDVQLGFLHESEGADESRIEPLGQATAPLTLTRSGKHEPTDSTGGDMDRLAGKGGGLRAGPKREPIPTSGSDRDGNAPRAGLGDHPERADARGRLDALARQLGERLRAAEGPRKSAEPADRPAPNGEKSGETR